MYSRALLVVVNLAFAIPLSGAALAQTPATALTGLVSSAENDVMEGVLVSASKMGSPVTVTVVTGKDGRFTFPASKLAQGQYSLGVRAIGYELDAHKAIEITEQKTTTLDLKLRKTEDLAAQLSNGEWLASIPGTDQQKGQLLNCVGCHTLERIVRSRYDAEAFLTQLLPRMQGYVNQSIPAHPQLRRAERLMEERGDQRVQVYRAAAEYLSTINLSAGSQWSYALKTFARPTGRATRVIYTEYGLPRETISPHDVIVDADGIVWYSSFGEQNLGRTRSQKRKGHRISDSRAQTGLSDRWTRSARRQGRQLVAWQYVSGHDHQIRPQGGVISILAAAARAEHRCRAG